MPRPRQLILPPGARRQRGSILLSAFSLAGRAEVPDISDLSDPLVSFVVGTGGDRPRIGFQFHTDGRIREATGDTGSALVYSDAGWWLDTNAAPRDASEWELRADIDTEDVGDPGTWSGTFAAWQALSASRTFTWTKDANDAGTAESELTIQLRQIAKPSNAASRSNLTYRGTITI